MPLIFRRDLGTDINLGIWDITESVEKLMSQLTLTENEWKLFNNLRGEQRKQHWLSYRLIIKKILNQEQILDIVYSPYGRPQILNYQSRVSVSHSGKYAAAIVSKNVTVGIDIEKIHPRAEKVIQRFLNEKEIKDLQNDYNIEHIHACWSAKEALYKLYGRKQLDFRQNLLLEPFVFKEKGYLYGNIKTAVYANRLKVYFELFDDYILAYVIDHPSHN